MIYRIGRSGVGGDEERIVHAGVVRGWTGTAFRWWRPHYELLGVGVDVPG